MHFLAAVYYCVIIWVELNYKYNTTSKWNAKYTLAWSSHFWFRILSFMKIVHFLNSNFLVFKYHPCSFKKQYHPCCNFWYQPRLFVPKVVMWQFILLLLSLSLILLCLKFLYSRDLEIRVQNFFSYFIFAKSSCMSLKNLSQPPHFWPKIGIVTKIAKSVILDRSKSSIIKKLFSWMW